MSGPISEQYSCLIDILTCMVCKQMVQKAHICPNCSKFYCLDCIIRQLAVEQTCLNCNKFLEVSMLVNCQKLCSELSETLEKVSMKRVETNRNNHQKLSLYCSKHRLQKTYYCKTCEKPLCSDCSVLTENHRGHEFIKLSLIRNSYESRIHEKVDEINTLQKNVEKRLEMAEVIRTKKGANNQKNLLMLDGSMKLLKEELRKNLKKVMNEGEKDLDRITEELQLWNRRYEEMMRRLKNCSKGKFVQREYEILEKELVQVIRGIDAQNEERNCGRVRVRQAEVSYIHPAYQEFHFVITDYSSKANDPGFFYTDSITTKMGLQWRLKVYPQGISPQSNQQHKLIKKHSKNEDTYFAIFLEFISGPVATTRQKYGLTLVNQINSSRNFTRQFQSQFDVGQCWGYEHFMKLTQIQEDVYNRQDDTLEVVLKICPSNYFQAAKDQAALIQSRRLELEKKSSQISKMEKHRSSKALMSTSSLIDI